MCFLLSIHYKCVFFLKANLWIWQIKFSALKHLFFFWWLQTMYENLTRIIFQQEVDLFLNHPQKTNKTWLCPIFKDKKASWMLFANSSKWRFHYNKCQGNMHVGLVPSVIWWERTICMQYSRAVMANIPVHSQKWIIAKII